MRSFVLYAASSSGRPPPDAARGDAHRRRQTLVPSAPSRHQLEAGLAHERLEAEVLVVHRVRALTTNGLFSTSTPFGASAGSSSRSSTPRQSGRCSSTSTATTASKSARGSSVPRLGDGDTRVESVPRDPEADEVALQGVELRHPHVHARGREQERQVAGAGAEVEHAAAVWHVRPHVLARRTTFGKCTAFANR